MKWHDTAEVVAEVAAATAAPMLHLWVQTAAGDAQLTQFHPPHGVVASLPPKLLPAFFQAFR